jgi:hypothetical protein
MAGILADDISAEDRRPVLGGGTRHGRDINIGDWRTIAEIGFTNITSTLLATRGNRLALSRFLISTADQRPEAFHNDVLGIVEVNADNRISAGIMFDHNDIGAAFDELDARYLAGEAAAHAHTWSVIARAYAGFNRHELPAVTPDCVNIDHRPLGRTIEAGDLAASIRAMWDLTPALTICMEAVHRLSDLGVAVAHTAHGTSQTGAEWRMVAIFTVEGDLINRCEWFDEADIKAALARFDELSAPALQLENAATRTWPQIVDACNRHDADGFLALTSADARLEDRRKGLRASHEGSAGRKAAQAMCRAPKSWRMEVEPVAIRGYRLALTREMARHR